MCNVVDSLITSEWECHHHWRPPCIMLNFHYFLQFRDLTKVVLEENDWIAREGSNPRAPSNLGGVGRVIDRLDGCMGNDRRRRGVLEFGLDCTFTSPSYPSCKWMHYCWNGAGWTASLTLCACCCVLQAPKEGQEVCGQWCAIAA